MKYHYDVFMCFKEKYIELGLKKRQSSITTEEFNQMTRCLSILKRHGFGFKSWNSLWESYGY
jgi:hypothetical protein